MSLRCADAQPKRGLDVSLRDLLVGDLARRELLPQSALVLPLGTGSIVFLLSYTYTQ